MSSISVGNGCISTGGTDTAGSVFGSLRSRTGPKRRCGPVFDPSSSSSTANGGISTIGSDAVLSVCSGTDAKGIVSCTCSGGTAVGTVRTRCHECANECFLCFFISIAGSNAVRTRRTPTKPPAPRQRVSNVPITRGTIGESL